jgi:hypothetical protein
MAARVAGGDDAAHLVGDLAVAVQQAQPSLSRQALPGRDVPWVRASGWEASAHSILWTTYVARGKTGSISPPARRVLPPQ